VHLVGLIKKKFVTMPGHTNVKLVTDCTISFYWPTVVHYTVLLHSHISSCFTHFGVYYLKELEYNYSTSNVYAHLLALC